MNNKIYTIEEIKEMIQPIAKKYPIKQLYLFGSYARGEATEKSDIDLMVEFNENYNISLMTLSDLIDDLESAFGKHVDCVSEKYASPKFLYEVIDDEVLMYASKE